MDQFEYVFKVRRETIVWTIFDCSWYGRVWCLRTVECFHYKRLDYLFAISQLQLWAVFVLQTLMNYICTTYYIQMIILQSTLLCLLSCWFFFYLFSTFVFTFVAINMNWMFSILYLINPLI